MTSVFVAGPAGADSSESSTVPASGTATAPEGPPATESAVPDPAVPEPVVPEPAVPEPQPGSGPVAQQVDLDVTAEFDKPAYSTGELVTITLRIANVGSDPAVGIRVFTGISAPTDLNVDPRQWGDLGTGATIEPGTTREVTLSGRPRRPDVDTVALRGNVFDQTGMGIEQFAFSAPITRTTSYVAGTVFGDRNGNGTFDSGEELAGAVLTWRDIGGGEFTVTATSGSDGRFDFGEIPTVSYGTSGEAPGFLVPFGRTDISASEDNTDLLVRAVLPLNGALHAAMAFTQDSYQPGELAHVTVTLTNSGPIPLVGIVAGCNRSGEGPQLSGDGPGWGDLGRIAAGVTLAPGETREFDVTENVPDIAAAHGFVAVACDFGFPDVDIENNPTAEDTAAVPGRIATLLGTILAVPVGSTEPIGLAGVRLVLVRAGPCPIVGETTTDGSGNFEFTGLTPAPDYELYLFPPAGWNFASDNPTSVRVIANQPGRLTLVAEPGDAPPPTAPTQPPSCTATPAPSPTAPVPQGRSSGGLASTGADVRWLGVLGLVTLSIGAGVVVGARRLRRTGS